MQWTIIQQKIYEARGFKGMLDFDLAELYEVETRIFNQAIKRNKDSFPEDFMFRLSSNEWANISSSQIVMMGNVPKNRTGKYLPYAFTERGVTKLASAKKILHLRVMIKVKNIGISFCYISLYILLSCSKSDHTTKPPPPAPILNTFTYTFTDTVGASFTFSDTVIFNPDSNKYYFTNSPTEYPTNPVAYILPPDSGNYNMRKFQFYDTKSMDRNYVTFYLPYFQSTLSGTTDLPNSSLTVQLDRIFYTLTPRPPIYLPINVYLASCSTSTNISDSTGGFVTGSFNISATTVDSGKIKISGQFSHLPANYKP